MIMCVFRGFFIGVRIHMLAYFPSVVEDVQASIQSNLPNLFPISEGFHSHRTPLGDLVA